MKEENTLVNSDTSKYLDYLGGILFITREDLSIEYSSVQVESILGYSQEEIKSQKDFWKKYIHADYLKLFEKTIQSSKSDNKIHTINFLFHIKDAEYRWFQARIHKVQHFNDIKISIFCTDVHQHQLEYMKGEEDRALNTELIKNLSHVFFLFTTDGRFIRWNNRLVEVSGYTDEEIQEMTPLDFFPEEVKPYITDMINTVLHQGRIEMEAVFQSREGVVKPIHFIGSRFVYKDEVCVSGVAIDISQQKKLLDDKVKLLNTIESILEFIPDSVLVLRESFNVFKENNSFRELIQTYSELLELDVSELKNTILQQVREQILANIFQPLTIKGANNKSLDLEVKFSNAFFSESDEEDKPTYVVTLIDVTQIYESQRLVEESRAQLDRTLNSSKDIICTVDKNGQFQTVSAACKEILGFLPSEMEGKTYLDFVVEKDRGATLRKSKEIEAGLEVTNFENRLISKCGLIVPMIWSAYWDNDIQLMFCVARDGREKKRAELDLEKNERRFRALVQDGSDLIAILDEQAVFKYASSNYESIIGYSEEFLLGKNGFDFFHPDDKEEVFKQFVMLQTEKRITSSPYRFKKNDGSWCWMQSVGTNMINDDSIQGIIVNSVEITNLIETQHALNVSNELYETVNKVTNDAIYDWDLIQDSFRWGEGFARIFGHDLDKKFTIKDWRKLEHPEDQQMHKSTWEEFIKDPTRSKWHNELRVKNANGDYIYAEEIGHVIRDEAGVPIRMIGVLRDISLRKEESLRKEIQHVVAQLFSLEQSLEDVLFIVLDFLRAKLSIPVIEIWINSDNGTFSNKAAFSVMSELYDLYIDSSNDTDKFEYGFGLPGIVWQNDSVHIWKDQKLKTDFARQKILKKLKIKTVVGVPIINMEKNIGQLIFMFDNSTTHKPSWIRSMDFLCTQLGDEIARKRQEEELKLLFNSAPDILAIAGPENRFVKVNPAFCKLLGYTEQEITSRPFSDFLHPDDVLLTNNEYFETVSGERQARGFLNRYKTKEGSYKWISWSSSGKFGIDNYVFSFGRDVTQMLKLQHMLDDATNLSRIGAWEFDMLKNKIFWSTMTKQIHGVSESFNPTLESSISFYREDFQPIIRSHIEKCIHEKLPFDLEAVLVTQNGEQCWVRVIGSSEHIDGECIRIFGSVQDIAEQKRIESELKKLNIELEKNMRNLEISNKELEQFAFVASHDLQEPLRMVNSFLTLLDKKYKNELDEKARSYINFAVQGSERMRSIILDLLEFSRAGDSSDKKLTTVDLNNVFDDIKILLKKQIDDAQASIQVDYLPTILGDHSRLRQVFQNLMSNAIKYRDVNRKLIITIYAEEFTDYIQVKVVDTGIGIEEKYHGKIFELFQRLHSKEQYSGTGIGLSITKKLLESIGGEINLESKVGVGTTFAVKLPKQLIIND